MKVESERDLSESFVKLLRSQNCGVFSTMSRPAVLGECRKAYSLGCTWPLLVFSRWASEGLLPHADLVPGGAIFAPKKGTKAPAVPILHWDWYGEIDQHFHLIQKLPGGPETAPVKRFFSLKNMRFTTVKLQFHFLKNHKFWGLFFGAFCISLWFWAFFIGLKQRVCFSGGSILVLHVFRFCNVFFSTSLYLFTKCHCHAFQDLNAHLKSTKPKNREPLQTSRGSPLVLKISNAG